MSDYSKIVDYAAKDLLLHGDPAKAIKGTEVGAEFDAIATMSATKGDKSGTLAQFAATTSAQLAGVINDETGSGALVFATSPTLVTPALGTPASGTLTNCTGLPVNGIVDDTTSALGIGSLELGHASDTTLTRVSAGVAAIEGVNILTTATGAAIAGSSSQAFATAALTASGNITLNNTSGTGVIRATGNSTVTTYMFGSSGGGVGAIGTETNHPCDLYTNGTQKVRIDTSGNVMVVTAALLGYGTGAGGTVTQTTSKSTAVTLNKPCGQITMHNAALGANTTVSFALNNSLISTSSNITFNAFNGATSVDNYIIWAYLFAGGAYVNVRNMTAGSLSEALVMQFNVHAGVAA